MLLCFFGLFFSKSEAQNEIRFGFQFSPTLSWLKSDASNVNKNGSLVLGAKLGALGEYYFRENYSLSGGIGFAFNHSGRLKYENEGIYWPNSDDLQKKQPGLDTISAGATLKYNLQYLEIPMSLKLRSGYFGTYRFFAEIPMLYLGFNTQAFGTINGNEEVFGGDVEKVNIGKDIRFFNLSWGFGGGVEYEVGSKTSLVGGLYYQQGFTDIIKNDGTYVDGNGNDQDENSKVTLGTFIIRLGVMF